MPSFDGNILTKQHEICSQQPRDSTLSYGKKPGVSISHGLGLVPACDGQIDEQRQTEL